MKIPDYYDKLSKSYNTLYGMEQRTKHDSVIKIIENQRFNIIVDIGCGDGELLCKLEGFCHEMTVGLDSSKGMLERAKLVLSEKVDVILGDGYYLPLREDRVDLTVSVSVASEDSAPAIISEATKIARPGGSILVSVIHPGRSAPDINLLPECHPSITRILSLSSRETLWVLTKPH